MADSPSSDMPKFNVTEKKVDQSWKDEVRKERELARQKAAEAPPKAAEAAGEVDSPAQEPSKDQPATGSPAPGAPAPGKKPEGKAAEPDKASKVFLSFIAQLVQQTLMQMGLMENPYTGQAEVNLEGARFTIDLLAVIMQKTKGNLTDQETKLLGESVRDLQMQYVELANEMKRQMQEQLLKQGPGGPGARPPR